jgi:hypothetical protein
MRGWDTRAGMQIGPTLTGTGLIYFWSSTRKKRALTNFSNSPTAQGKDTPHSVTGVFDGQIQ